MTGKTKTICRVVSLATLTMCLWLQGCGEKEPPLYATLTLKGDGSQYAGHVVRREATSITVTGYGGETRTFLYTELQDIKYGAPDEAASASTSGVSSTPTAASTATAGSASIGVSTIEIPAGTQFPIRTNGFLDSCCVPEGATSLGTVDEDIHVASKVAIPAGANVTIVLMDSKKVDGRKSLTFELGSADFGGHHYLISSVKGGTEPGVVVTFTGAKEGTKEAGEQGMDIHIDDHSFMGFKAVNPAVFRLSQ